MVQIKAQFGQIITVVALYFSAELSYVPVEDMVVLESTRRDGVGVGQNIVDVNVEGHLFPFSEVTACTENVHLFCVIYVILPTFFP